MLCLMSHASLCLLMPCGPYAPYDLLPYILIIFIYILLLYSIKKIIFFGGFMSCHRFYLILLLLLYIYLSWRVHHQISRVESGSGSAIWTAYGVTREEPK